MARVRKSMLSFEAITLEGSLISSAKFAAIAECKAEEQSVEDYKIPMGLTLRDETARYFRMGQALFRDLHASKSPSLHKTIQFTQELLSGVFGFVDVLPVNAPRVRDERQFPLTFEALGGRVPIVVVSPADDLDHPSPSLSHDRRRSAASALQDWLDAEDAALWGLCTNGESLRLLRDNESLTRPAFLEADLRQIFEAEDYAGFSALWLALHVSRFGRIGALASDCALERWRESGSKEGLAARDRLRDGVEQALLALGTGFLTHPENTELSERLRGGTFPVDEYFRQLLRLVYRLIFLLATEDRNLLHTPDATTGQRKLYAEGYSLGALRDRAIRRSGWDNFQDRWSGLCVTFRALANGGPRLGLPALGGIFATTATPELETAHISNRYLMEAIFRLAWLRDDGLLMPVNWRDMETEELGSVYESLLELTPRLSSNGREFLFAKGVQTKGNARKTSGSYYTPDSLVQVLLDSALDPLLDRVESESEDPVRGLLGVTVIDPACGSGHFLLAAARRIAKRVVRLRHGDIHTEQQRLAALRDVVRSCVHGVDRNPMAVELTKVALWIETVESGKPLGFLDANIRLGDSLLGIFSIDALREGIPDAAYKPLTGDDKTIARDFARKNKDEIKGQSRMRLSGAAETPTLPRLAQSLRSVRQLPENTVQEVEAKSSRFESATHDPRLQKIAQAADLYIAAFLTPKTVDIARGGGDSLIATTADVHTAMNAGTVYGPRLGAARQLASAARTFHWPLEYPDIMNAGGFDVVLGNPPWERIKLQEQEFFAAREPEIAEAANAAARGRLIAALKTAQPGSREALLHAAFELAKRTAEASSVFARLSAEEQGRFPLTGRGDVNTYALFAELFCKLSSPKGRAGVIVPTGIATDATTAPFFAELVGQRRLARLIDFENRAGLFPNIDSRIKFSLVTLASGIDSALFTFFLTDPAQRGEPERLLLLTQADFALLNPNTRTSAIFRSRKDADLTKALHSRIPIFGKSSTHEGWGPELFKKMFDFDVHKRLLEFSTSQPTKDHLPLYEAKMISHFDHRFSTYEGVSAIQVEKGSARETQFAELENPHWEITPRCWTTRDSFALRMEGRGWSAGWFLSMRDVARSTDERTGIFAVRPFLPSNDKLPTVFVKRPADDSAVLVANLSSLTLDFVARQKVGGTNLAGYVVEQLPVIPPMFYIPKYKSFIVPRVLELTYTSYSMTPFARDLGYDGKPFAWDEDRRALLRAELDAWYARAYGLTRDELRYILDPADVMGPDYPSETFRVLKEKELKLYKEFRTQRLVVDAWDRMERGELHKPAPYQKPAGGSAAPTSALTSPPSSADQARFQFSEDEPK